MCQRIGKRLGIANIRTQYPHGRIIKAILRLTTQGGEIELKQLLHARHLLGMVVGTFIYASQAAL